MRRNGGLRVGRECALGSEICHRAGHGAKWLRFASPRDGLCAVALRCRDRDVWPPWKEEGTRPLQRSHRMQWSEDENQSDTEFLSDATEPFSTGHVLWLNIPFTDGLIA